MWLTKTITRKKGHFLLHFNSYNFKVQNQLEKKLIKAFYGFAEKQKKLLDSNEQLLTNKNIGQKRIKHHKALLMIKKKQIRKDKDNNMKSVHLTKCPAGHKVMLSRHSRQKKKMVKFFP